MTSFHQNYISHVYTSSHLFCSILHLFLFSDPVSTCALYRYTWISRALKPQTPSFYISKITSLIETERTWAFNNSLYHFGFVWELLGIEVPYYVSLDSMMRFRGFLLFCDIGAKLMRISWSRNHWPRTWPYINIIRIWDDNGREINQKYSQNQCEIHAFWSCFLAWPKSSFRPTK